MENGCDAIAVHGCTTTPHHTLLTLPTHMHTHSSAYVIQQARNTPCRGPGAYSVNVWGQRASTRINNRQNNQPRKPYMQAKNLQRHLKKVHGENCTVDKFYCIVFAKPSHNIRIHLLVQMSGGRGHQHVPTTEATITPGTPTCRPRTCKASEEDPW